MGVTGTTVYRAAAPALASVIDDFNRADTTSGTLGTRSDGGAYHNPGAWYISGNQARLPTSGTPQYFGFVMPPGDISGSFRIIGGGGSFPDTNVVLRSNVSAYNLINVENSGYRFMYFANGSGSTLRIYRLGVLVAESATFSLGNAGTNAPLGGTMFFSIIGATLNLSLSWANNTTKFLSYTDSSPLGDPTPSYCWIRGEQQAAGNTAAYPIVDDLFLSTPSTIALSDNFDRADGALGQTSVGSRPWSTSGGAWAILTNQARPTTAVEARAWVECGSPNGTVQVTQTVNAGGQWGILFRYLDDNNYWIAYQDYGGSTMVVEKIVAGVRTGVGGVITNAEMGFGPDVVKVILLGTSIKVYCNNFLTHDLTSSDNLTNTKHGMFSNQSIHRMDDWSYTP